MHRCSLFEIPPNAFSRLRIPEAFYKNHFFSQQSFENNPARKNQAKEDKDDTSKICKHHTESLRKYRLQISKSRSRMKHPMELNQEKRVCSQDPRNMFLKKMVKSGKIRTYDREELQTEVLSNLKTLTVESWKNVTQRNVRTAQSATRQKSKVLSKRPPTAGRTVSRDNFGMSKAEMEFQSELRQVLGPINPQGEETVREIFDFAQEAQRLKESCLDRSISYRNVMRIRDFIGEVKEFQTSLDQF